MSNSIEKPEVFEECLSFRLRQANRVMTQIYDHHLAVCDLRVTQYSILHILNMVKETTNKGLQDILVIDQSTLSRNLKPLFRDGYLNSIPGQDRREKRLSLTKEGKKLFRRARKYWANAQQEMHKKLGSRVTKQLLTLSKNIVSLKET